MNEIGEIKNVLRLSRPTRRALVEILAPNKLDDTPRGSLHLESHNAIAMAIAILHTVIKDLNSIT